MAFILIITIVLLVLYLVSFLAMPKNESLEKLSPYESGFEPIAGDAKMKFDIIFWIIGLLYLIFDLEIIFLFPLGSILFTMNSLLAYWVALIFLIVLTLAFLYEWKQGALKLIP